MKQSRIQLNVDKLNSNIHEYWYTIDSRPYVHGTTIISAVCDILKPKDVEYTLWSTLTGGFKFSSTPTEDTVGWVSHDLFCCYIVPLEQDLQIKNEFGETQQYLMNLNNIAQEYMGEYSFYSRKLYVDVFNVVDKKLLPEKIVSIKQDKRNWQVKMFFNSPDTVEGYSQNVFRR